MDSLPCFAFDFRARNEVYEVTAEQKYCPEGWAIRTPVECHAAAVSLSKGWLGTVYEEGQPYCRSFNGNVVFNGGGDAAPANFSSVCKAPEELSESSSTKVYELVGAGICRPGSCDSADGACRVGGYFKENLTLTECRSVCDADAGCVGYSHLPGARCEVHSTGPVPADWVPAAGPFSSIGDADGSSTAACYREAPVQVQRGWPGGGACFLQQPTRGNGNCGGPHRTWTLDQHGHHFEWAGENEALCLVRKVEHDFYCGTNTTWLFVPQTEAEVPSPRAVSEHITWLMMKEMLRAAELRPCSEPPFERFRWRPHSRGGRRRRDDRRLQSSTTNWVRDNLARRKILVAPYKGEVKQLLDMMVVEALLSGVEERSESPAIRRNLWHVEEHIGRFPGPAVPVPAGAWASGAELPGAHGGQHHVLGLCGGGAGLCAAAAGRGAAGVGLQLRRRTRQLPRRHECGLLHPGSCAVAAVHCASH
ncbi:unnamed protein product [Effrenium voratum]|uniref:Uncharacterized protein n=1 Tax=Effrenium voratum TaxID=2562239 RepID=A0AA36HNH2_9DINO|nr:unnamed protein product [Effrenium voratum]